MFAVCFGAGATLLCLLLLTICALEVVQSGLAYANIVPVSLTAYSQVFGFRLPLTKWIFCALMFLQWFAVGFGLSLLFRRRRGHDDAA
jgi:hypothetical protein